MIYSTMLKYKEEYNDLSSTFQLTRVVSRHHSETSYSDLNGFLSLEQAAKELIPDSDTIIKMNNNRHI